MSHLQYYNYEGFGERAKVDVHYSQAVRIGDIIELSGQGVPISPSSLNMNTNPFPGGLDRITEEFPEALADEVDQAFANVEHALQKAGGSGWEQVYKVRIFVSPWSDEMLGELIRNLKKYCPNHRPALTAVGVAKLYNNMRLEVEVTAHVGDKK